MVDLSTNFGKMEWQDMFSPKPGKDDDEIQLDETIQAAMKGKEHLFPGYCIPILKPQYVMRFLF